MTEDITIIGAGIGGLTTALTLKQKGCQLTVYESASEIKPVGAGIIMANNAMQIFQKLGIEHRIVKAGNKVSSMKITDEKLTPISIMELSKFERKYGVHNVAIHRGELQKILAEEIGYENIQLSKRLLQIEQNDTIKLTFSDSSVKSSRIVIGADGIKSTVRNRLFNGSEIRDTKQLCWRGVSQITLPTQYQHEAIEAWGKGKRFGFVKISNDKVYWYAVANEQLVNQDNVDLSYLFKEFHSDITKIISEAQPSDIILNRITDLKPTTKWQHKNVCLIGDAAHATTPNLGQGACQAIEDAYTLGQLYSHDKSIENIFAQYEKLRLKKVHRIVNTSWTIGKVAHLENSFAIWLRNTLMRSVPKSANSKQLEKIFDIGYV